MRARAKRQGREVLRRNEWAWFVRLHGRVWLCSTKYQLTTHNATPAFISANFNLLPSTVHPTNTDNQSSLFLHVGRVCSNDVRSLLSEKSTHTPFTTAMASQGEFSAAITNRSLRTIRTVCHPQQYCHSNSTSLHDYKTNMCGRSWNFSQMPLLSHRNNWRTSYLNYQTRRNCTPQSCRKQAPYLPQYNHQCNHQNLLQPSILLLPSFRIPL